MSVCVCVRVCVCVCVCVARAHVHLGIEHACVRVGAQGFIWLLNSSVRGSGLADSATIKEIAAKRLNLLSKDCESIGICFDLLIDIIESCWTGLSIT